MTITAETQIRELQNESNSMNHMTYHTAWTGHGWSGFIMANLLLECGFGPKTVLGSKCCLDILKPDSLKEKLICT